MTTVTEDLSQTRSFEADVAKLLHLMVHSVYSEKDVFLRELISNAADACEKLRYEAVSDPSLLTDDAQPRITVILDKQARRLIVEDNGIGMTAEEMGEALGTIARSGHQGVHGADRRRQGGRRRATDRSVRGRVSIRCSWWPTASKWRRGGPGTHAAALWASDGQGAYTIAPLKVDDAPARGTRVTLHLKQDADGYEEPYDVERIVKTQSGTRAGAYLPARDPRCRTPDGSPMGRRYGRGQRPR